MATKLDFYTRLASVMLGIPEADVNYGQRNQIKKRCYSAAFGRDDELAEAASKVPCDESGCLSYVPRCPKCGRIHGKWESQHQSTKVGLDQPTVVVAPPTAPAQATFKPVWMNLPCVILYRDPQTGVIQKEVQQLTPEDAQFLIDNFATGSNDGDVHV